MAYLSETEADVIVSLYNDALCNENNPDVLFLGESTPSRETKFMGFTVIKFNGEFYALVTDMFGDPTGTVESILEKDIDMYIGD